MPSPETSRRIFVASILFEFRFEYLRIYYCALQVELVDNAAVIGVLTSLFRFRRCGRKRLLLDIGCRFGGFFMRFGFLYGRSFGRYGLSRHRLRERLFCVDTSVRRGRAAFGALRGRRRQGMLLAEYVAHASLPLLAQIRFADFGGFRRSRGTAFFLTVVLHRGHYRSRDQYYNPKVIHGVSLLLVSHCPSPLCGADVRERR